MSHEHSTDPFDRFATRKWYYDVAARIGGAISATGIFGGLVTERFALLPWSVGETMLGVGGWAGLGAAAVLAAREVDRMQAEKVAAELHVEELLQTAPSGE